MTDAERVGEVAGTVRVKSPPGVGYGPVGSWNVPATAEEIAALRDGTMAERERATEALTARLFHAYAHYLMYGNRPTPSSAVPNQNGDTP